MNKKIMIILCIIIVMFLIGMGILILNKNNTKIDYSMFDSNGIIID